MSDPRTKPTRPKRKEKKLVELHTVLYFCAYFPFDLNTRLVFDASTSQPHSFYVTMQENCISKQLLTIENGETAAFILIYSPIYILSGSDFIFKYYSKRMIMHTNLCLPMESKGIVSIVNKYLNKHNQITRQIDMYTFIHICIVHCNAAIQS